MVNIKYNIWFILLFVLLLSANFALAADCVWRPVLTSNGGIFYTLYEADNKIYVGSHNKIYVSTDNGDSFNTYSDAPNQVIYLNKVSSKFIAGTLDGTYLLAESGGDVKWTQVFEPAPYTSTSQMLATVGDIIYSSDYYDEIIYKQLFAGKSTTGNLTTKLPAASPQIFDMEANGNTLWAAVKPGFKLYKLTTPLGQWTPTSQVASHVILLDTIRFKGNTIYLSALTSDLSASMYYSEDNGATWALYPAQIPGAKKYADMLMASADSYILVNVEDQITGQKAKVYQQRGSGWQEYGLGLKTLTGKDILKTNSGVLLVLGGGPGDGDNVNKCKPNQAPVPNAGSDIVVFKGEKVTLDGSKTTDAEGDKITYNWEQPGAIMTALLDEDTASPSFVAKNPGTYIFQLSATDEYGAESKTSDQVTVTVIGGDNYYLVVEGTATHHDWNLGQDYALGDAYFSSVKQDFDFPFKVYSADYFLQNSPKENAGMYDIFNTKPSQGFTFYKVDSFDKAAIFMRSGGNFNLEGDTITLKIKKGSLDGEVVAQASRFIEKSLIPHWEEFVFASQPDAQDNPPADDGSDDGSGPSGGGNSGGSDDDEDNGPTIQCTSNSGCGSGFVCKNFKCVNCIKDSECKSGEVCKTGKCVKKTATVVSSLPAQTDASATDVSDEEPELPGCVDDNGCALDQACKEGVCTDLNCGADHEVFNHGCKTSDKPLWYSSFSFGQLGKWIWAILALVGILIVLVVCIVLWLVLRKKISGTTGAANAGAAGAAETSKIIAVKGTKAAKAKSKLKK